MARALCCALALLTAALADELAPEVAQDLLSRLDKDGDGKASLRELLDFSELVRKTAAEREMKYALEYFDKDRDGWVSRLEFQGGVDYGESEESEGGESEESEDGESEGSEGGGQKKKREISEEEAMRADELFKATDADADGYLDAKEFADLYASSSPGTQELAGSEFVKRFDEDGDGELSPEELEGVEGASIEKLDTDGSGRLDALELAPVATGEFGADQAMEEGLRLADADGDGHISLEELGRARPEFTGHLTGLAAQHDEL